MNLKQFFIDLLDLQKKPDQEDLPEESTFEHTNMFIVFLIAIMLLVMLGTNSFIRFVLDFLL